MPAIVLFFPAASIYAALVIPLSLLAMIYYPDQLVSLNSRAGHAQALLSGFVPAVIAGYLLGMTTRRYLGVVFLLWLISSVARLFWPYMIVSASTGSVFTLLLAWKLVPRFRAAKKWRNRLLSPLLLAIFLLAAALPWMTFLPGPDRWQHHLLQQFLQLLTLLMLFMGGRMIAPAVAGFRYSRGESLSARVQPRLEALMILAMLGAIVFSLASGVSLAAGACLAAAGLLSLVRLLRWQLWHCLSRLDLLALGVGYLWLALGLLAWGVLILLNQSSAFWVHMITVGALGTLTSSVMMRTAILQTNARANLGGLWEIPLVAGLITLASLSRLLADLAFTPYLPFLWAAACLWTIAWTITAIRLIKQCKLILNRRSAKQILVAAD